MKYLILLLSGLVTFNTHAEVDTSDLATPDESIEAPALNLEGQVNKKPEVVAPVVAVKEVKKPLSPSEVLKLRRQQLEVRNRIMVEKKMEQIRFQQELALAKKLEDSMNKTIQAIDIK